MDDIGDMQADEPELAIGASGVLTGSAATERMRSRAKRNGSGADEPAADEAAEALRWAEENIPGLDEEDVDAINNTRGADDEQARLIQTELSKLN